MKVIFWITRAGLTRRRQDAADAPILTDCDTSPMRVIALTSTAAPLVG